MSNQRVKYQKIGPDSVLQRIDNYLIKLLKGVPKTHIYRIIRKGEVRVNKKRVAASYKLQSGDMVRIPPLQTSLKTQPKINTALTTFLQQRIIYEDDSLLVINKPAGMPVHGGSGLQGGLINILRVIRPQAKFLELVHRLDKETSGCLLIAKDRTKLRQLHEKIRLNQIEKHYLALVKGQWPKRSQIVQAPLRKQVLRSGERMVEVHPSGLKATTKFNILENYKQATLVEVELMTGRTHQIRVHCLYQGHPIAGDEKYGDKEFNQQMRLHGLKRMFLHASSLKFSDEDGKVHHFSADLATNLQQVIKSLC